MLMFSVECKFLKVSFCFYLLLCLWYLVSFLLLSVVMNFFMVWRIVLLCLSVVF